MTATPANLTTSNPNVGALARSALAHVSLTKSGDFSSLIDDSSAEPAPKAVKSGSTAKSSPAKKTASDEKDAGSAEINLSWLQNQTQTAALDLPLPVPQGGSSTAKATEKAPSSPSTATVNDKTSAQSTATSRDTSDASESAVVPVTSNQAAASAATAQAVKVITTQTAEKAAAQADTGSQSAATTDNETTESATTATATQQTEVTDATAAGNAAESMIASFLATAGNASSSALSAGDAPDAIAGAALTGATSTSGASATAPMLAGLAVTAGNGVDEVENSAPENATGAKTPAPALPVMQVALSISRNIDGTGNQSFTLQLKPEALGKVEVKLEIDAKGQATATFKADRPETLHLLQHDSQHLLAALNEAGISADSTDLIFSLNEKTGDQPSGSPEDSAANDRSRSNFYAAAPADDASTPARTVASNRLYDIQA